MSMFTKPKKEPVMSDNGTVRIKSKWQGVIDHMNSAHKHMSEAMNLLSLITFDLQKGADFIVQYRDSLIRTIEESGGEVEPEPVEEAIRDFIPKHLQRAPEAPDERS